MIQKDMIFGLDHGARRQIIGMLKDGKKRHLELCKELKVSPSEVTRHCKCLEELGIIRKNRSAYEITNMGLQLVRIANNIEFLDEQRLFFEEHNFDMIPEELDVIAVLEKCDMVKGPMKILDGILSTNNSALDSINCIFEETIDHLVIEHVEQLARGIRINILVKKGARIPHEYMEKRTLGQEIRQIEEIPIGMIATESAGLIIPRHKMGILDYGFGAYGNDETFMRFCDYIFNYYWVGSKPIIL